MKNCLLKWCFYSGQTFPATHECICTDDYRLRVVSNFGDGDCGARKIHTRVRAKFRGDATRRERRKLLFHPPHNRHRQNSRLLAVYDDYSLASQVACNLVHRARSKCHGLWDNQKPDATFAASGFLKRMLDSLQTEHALWVL